MAGSSRRPWIVRWCAVFCLPWVSGWAAGWTEGKGYRVREVRPEGTGRAGFTRMLPAATGVAFTNVLAGDAYLTNFVAHNGSGVAIGDVDGDGWQDIYLCGLQSSNRLYRNLGQWRFAEIPIDEAACRGQFSTGAVMVDVEGDRDLDLLVSGIGVGTRLFLNDGKGGLSEARDTGLSRTSSPTTLAVADIDGDGDLDIYAAHYIDVMHLMDRTVRFALARQGDGWVVQKVNGEPATLPRWKDRFEALPDGSVRELPEVHAVYRNDGRGHFSAVQLEPGFYLGEDGKPVAPYRDWGLAAMFRDLNGDGAPDLYVCNDNASPDRIWINSGKGTFRAISSQAMRHISRSSMGVDFADVDRDGQVDVFVTDMLARAPERRQTQLVRDRPEPDEVERVEARPAFNRNTLFFGRPDGSFAEAALMAGVAATDWSWCPVFLDVDLDGYEDLLVTTGFDLDVMDQDSNDQLRVRLRQMNPEQKRKSRQLHPSFRTRNLSFRNRGDGTFEAMGSAWGFDEEGVSHGMGTGDLDNDGDLDVVVNRFNDVAGLYRNDSGGGRIAVSLQGTGANTAGIGARLQVSGGRFTQTQEMISGGRYLSGDQSLRVFAASAGTNVARTLEVIWPNHQRTVIDGLEPNRFYEVRQKEAGEVVAPTPKPPGTPWFREVSEWLGHRHLDEPFDDFARQPLLPRKMSRLGPGVAWYDLNADGWEDLIIAAGHGGRPGIFLNENGRSFRRLEGGVATAGDQGAMVGWPDGIGGRWLLAALSGYEQSVEVGSEILAYPVLDLMGLPRSIRAGPACLGPLALADIDGDGDLDLFAGGRFKPGRYPEPVNSGIWRNNRGGLEPDADNAEAFAKVGLVAGATFADLDGDGDADLALALEWGPVRIFLNEGGRFVDSTGAWGMSEWTGWWTGIAAGDFDGDGRFDLAVGNWGRNSLYELYQPGPWRAYFGDWDGDGPVEVMEAWRKGDDWFPIRHRAGLAAGMPGLGTRFPTHAAYAAASVAEILDARIANAGFVEAGHLESAVFLNRGSRFERRALPAMAQRAPIFSLQVADLDGDGIEDLFASQNFSGAGSDLTREDAGRGLCLRGVGDGSFIAMDGSITGVQVDGEQRGAAVADFNHDGRVDLVVTQNGGATRLFVNETARPGVRVKLTGSMGNPDGIGAQMRVVYSGGAQGPVRGVQAGSGYDSQDAAIQVMGLGSGATSIWVRWPGGREETVPLPPDPREVRLDFTHESSNP